MTRRLVLTLLLGVFVGAVLGAAVGRGAPDQKTLVIDRTLSCATVPTGGVREIGVRANTGFRQGRTWQILAFAVVSTGTLNSLFTPVDDSFAWVAAGKYDRNTTLTATDGPGLVNNVTRLGTWALNRSLCRPSTARVPLSGKGLRDEGAGALGVSFDCTAPPRVLVRVRIVPHSPPTLYRHGEYEKTKASLKQGFLAVRTQAGKQLAFASVSDSGAVRLAVAPSCTED